MAKKPTKKAPAKKNKGGRPSIFNEQMIEDVCVRLMLGEGLRAILDGDPELPHVSTWFYWLHGRGISLEQQEWFVELYVRAREAQAEMMMDEILSISDDNSGDVVVISGEDGDEYIPNPQAVNRARLQVDSRKFLAMKLLPRFADKLILEGGDKAIKIDGVDEIDASRRIAMLLAEGRAARKRREENTEE